MASRNQVPKKVTQYLDPKIDVVFKMLFANENHENILAGFIGAVLNKTVTKATVLNPSIPRDLPSDKEIFLDISARLETGEKVDVEMQMNSHHFFPERCLYYWARLHAKQLQRGATNYADLRPTHSIIVLNFELLRNPLLAEKYHSVIEALVRGSPEPFSPHFRMHTIELPKLARQKNVNLTKDAVAQWGHFMLNPTKETLEKLSKLTPVFNEVQEVMTTISANQRAQYLADQRLKGRLDQAQRESDARQDGRSEGHSEGRSEERRANALGMLEAGATHEFVCKALKITEEQLSELLAAPNPKET